MPTAPRRPAQQQQARYVDPASDPEDGDVETEVTEDQLEHADGANEEDDEGYEEEDQLDTADASDPDPASAGPPPLPAHLKDISGLASWTVSTAKPGCSVAQLRAPSTSLFWQSDGPQPHHLNIHFFKMVEIAGIRIYLDFDLDESYTPTKVAFLAGTGYNDLQEWCVMEFESPKGWVDVDFSGVGVEGGDGDGDGDGDDDEPMDADDVRKRWPVLRAMLVQMQIRENHQNGKDTHLRGLQIFARDKSVAAAAGAGTATGGLREGHRASAAIKSGRSGGTARKPRTWLPEPMWEGVPTLR